MNLPRILLASAHTGSGKTLLTCGILQTLINRGLKVSSFKCGPEHSDTLFHTQVVCESRNLDTFFTGDNMTRYLLAKNSREADIAVMEGTKGFYDGIGFTTQASSYDLAHVTGTPVILLVNGKDMNLSIVSMIHGMITFRKDANIQGVILNQVSQSNFKELRELIERECKVKVLGYVPNVRDYTLDTIHPGILPENEIAEFHEKLMTLSSILEQCIDFPALIEIAKNAPDLSYEELTLPKLEKPIRIGIARDQAFCHYYEDNLQMLKDMGAELVAFSPIWDAHLPENIHALIMGGGFPSLFAGIMSKNETMRSEIKEAILNGMPCMAECGGFLYLHEEMEDMKHFYCPMAGVVPAKGFRNVRLKQSAYVNLVSNCDQLLGQEGTVFKGYEYHYYDSSDCGNAFRAQKPSDGQEWQCIHSEYNMLAGYPHLYYYSNPEAVYRFLEKGSQYAAR